MFMRRLLLTAALLLAALTPSVAAAQAPRSAPTTRCYRSVCPPDYVRDVTGGGGGLSYGVMRRSEPFWE